MRRESGELVESCLNCPAGCEALRAQENPRQSELSERLYTRYAVTRARYRLFGRSQRAIMLATVRVCFSQGGCRERVQLERRMRLANDCPGSLQ
jgi:hypothetical protein